MYLAAIAVMVFINGSLVLQKQVAKLIGNALQDNIAVLQELACLWAEQWKLKHALKKEA